jgi:hypothetical protein
MVIHGHHHQFVVASWEMISCHLVVVVAVGFVGLVSLSIFYLVVRYFFLFLFDYPRSDSIVDVVTLFLMTVQQTQMTHHERGRGEVL